MIVTRTFDTHIIKSFLAEDYNTLAGDEYPSFECWHPCVDKNTFYLIASSTKKVGLFIFKKLNPVLVECHVCIPRTYRGKGSEQLGIAAMKFMRETFGIRKFVAYIPHIKPLARRYSTLCGFTYVGTLQKSFQKKDQLIDMDIMESY